MTTEVTTTKKQSIATRIRAYKLVNPKAMPKEISKALGIPVARIYATNNYDRVKAKRAKKKLGWKTVSVAMSNASTAAAPKTDPVNHPAHYKVGGIETIDFIEAKQLNYNLGNVVKYITRADHKGNTQEDLLKARWYLNREIAKVNKGAK
jgi:arginine deiminase